MSVRLAAAPGGKSPYQATTWRRRCALPSTVVLSPTGLVACPTGSVPDHFAAHGEGAPQPPRPDRPEVTVASAQLSGVRVRRHPKAHSLRKPRADLAGKRGTLYKPWCVQGTNVGAVVGADRVHTHDPDFEAAGQVLGGTLR